MILGRFFAPGHWAAPHLTNFATNSKAQPTFLQILRHKLGIYGICMYILYLYICIYIYAKVRSCARRWHPSHSRSLRCGPALAGMRCGSYCYSCGFGGVTFSDIVQCCLSVQRSSCEDNSLCVPYLPDSRHLYSSWFVSSLASVQALSG